MMRRMERTIRRTILVLQLALATCGVARAQHTLGVTGGFGMATGRLNPTQEMRAIWGVYNAGLSWRHYSETRFVGGFGLDLEFMQQGFSYAPYASITENEADYRYYTRRINTLMLPVVWQPHFYLARRHLRVYFEAAATFSYNLSSTYENEVAEDEGKESWKGDYHFKLARDNRWGYGLAGGGGFAVLTGRLEVGVRVRYYFGLSDIVRARTKYSGNNDDGPENPFTRTPLRSPLDNLNVSFCVAWRFGREGFREWSVPRRKREKSWGSFEYKMN